MIKERDFLKILMNGIVTVQDAKAPGYRTPPRFLEEITETTQRITEVETGNIFYRLGQEFHSAESLALVAERHPMVDVRDKALQILGSVKSGELLKSFSS